MNLINKSMKLTKTPEIIEGKKKPTPNYEAAVGAISDYMLHLRDSSRTFFIDKAKQAILAIMGQTNKQEAVQELNDLFGFIKYTLDTNNYTNSSYLQHGPISMPELDELHLWLGKHIKNLERRDENSWFENVELNANNYHNSSYQQGSTDTQLHLLLEEQIKKLERSIKNSGG
jgi:hypothetical protein